MSIVTKDGYLIDDETGEVVGHADSPEAFRVTDLASAEWVLEKMQTTDADIAALESRKRAIVANIDAQVKAHQSRRQWLDARFLNDLRQFAAVALSGVKAKTVVTPFGKMSFRKVASRVVVTDTDAALAWAEREMPGAVKVSKSILVSAIPRGMDLPAFAFGLTETEERFSVDTGIKAAREEQS